MGTNNPSYGAGIDSPIWRNNYIAGRDVIKGDTTLITPTVEDNIFVGNADPLADYEDNTFTAWGSASDACFVRPNDYDTERANVTIYNWSGADTVVVDLSAVTGLSSGDIVRVHNCQDYFSDVQILTLDADKKISVDMKASTRTIAAPTLWTAPVSCFPVFGCFIVKKL